MHAVNGFLRVAGVSSCPGPCFQLKSFSYALHLAMLISSHVVGPLLHSQCQSAIESYKNSHCHAQRL